MANIITQRPHGGILYLPQALEHHPRSYAVLMHRVSEIGSQTGGKGWPKLVAKTNALFNELRNRAPRRVCRMPFYGVERGQVSIPRPLLIEASEYARRGYCGRRCILVAADLSRLIRAADYHRRTNREAWPTEDEFEMLRDLTGGIVLATLVPPELSESERHSIATKRTGRCGRPRAMDEMMKYRALKLLGPNMACDGEPAEWIDRSMREVARKLQISPTSLQRFLASPVPGMPGVRWLDLADPERAFRKIYLPD